MIRGIYGAMIGQKNAFSGDGDFPASHSAVSSPDHQPMKFRQTTVHLWMTVWMTVWMTPPFGEWPLKLMGGFRV